MQSKELGRDLLVFVECYVPDFAQQIKGCTSTELEQMEAIAREVSGRPLPRFYLWFLETMGAQMGRLKPPRSQIDYSAQAILTAYQSGRVRRVSGYFLVGVIDGPLEEFHLHLNLLRQTENDAPVVKMSGRMGPHDPEDELYDSLQENFAHRLFKYECVRQFHCVREGGIYADPEAEPPRTAADMNSAFLKMGFERMPITGMRCPMYYRRDAAVCLWTPPTNDPDEGYALTIGAVDERTAARTLEILDDSLQWKFMRTDHIAR